MPFDLHKAGDAALTRSGADSEKRALSRRDLEPAPVSKIRAQAVQSRAGPVLYGDVPLGLGFEALGRLREQVDRRTPVVELDESYASLYGNLWAAYKDRFQWAICILEPELKVLWDKESKFENAGAAFVERRPEYTSLVELVRSYRVNFQNALSTYRNTHLEHRAEADPKMLESFHHLDSAEDTFEKIWRAIEAITAGVVVANLPAPLVLLEIPEVHRDPARPERFRIGL